METADEADYLYSFIGKYVISFQWAEAKLEEIVQLSEGFANWTSTAEQLVNLPVAKKINLVEEIVAKGEAFPGVLTNADWLLHFRATLELLRAEARRRNRIVHSFYLFDFMDIGGPPLGSFRARHDGAIENHWLSVSETKAIFAELAEVSFELAQAHLQLVAWKATQEPTPES